LIWGLERGSDQDLIASDHHPQVRIVGSFAELVNARFSGDVNALCWPRQLQGNFDEVVAQLNAGEEIDSLDETILRGLSLSPAGRQAVDVLLKDLSALQTLGLAPVLNCIRRYPRDEPDAVVPLDVYSFHADSATVETDTYLCSYSESASEGLGNADALRCVDVPETWARLLQEFGGEEGAEFREYLHENCYDLHYAAKPGAQPYPFGLGNFWRIAVDYPGSPVLPCVHRAPENLPGRPARLLLIS